MGLQKPCLCSCSGFDWLDFVQSAPADVSSGVLLWHVWDILFAWRQPLFLHLTILPLLFSLLVSPSLPPSFCPSRPFLFGNIDSGSHCAVLAGLARPSQSYCLFPCNGNWALEGGLWYRCLSPSCSEHLTDDLFIAGNWVLFCCFGFIPGTSASEEVCGLSAPRLLCSITFQLSVEVLEMPGGNCLRRVEMPILFVRPLQEVPEGSWVWTREPIVSLLKKAIWGRILKNNSW